MSVDSHVDVCGRLCQELYGFRELCCSVNSAVPENANGEFSLVLENMNAVVEFDYVVASRKEAVEGFRVAEETAISVFLSWTVEKINLRCKPRRLARHDGMSQHRFRGWSKTSLLANGSAR